MNEFEPVPQSAAPVGNPSAAVRMATMTAGFASGMLFEIASKGGELAGVVERDQLAEPWDFPDHVGNFTEAGMYTTAAFVMLSLVSKRRNGELTARGATISAAGAVAVSSAIQILGEKYGIGIGSNSGDMTDAAYGVAFSFLVAGLCATGFRKAEKMSTSRAPRSERARDSADDFVPAPRPRPKVSPAVKKAKRKQQSNSRKNNRPKK